MKKALQSTKQEFESACNRTPQYLTWHRLFKREFTKFLLDNGATNVYIHNPNHFDMSGFFTLLPVIWYFSISDLRGFKDKMLIRTAQSYKDYTGGKNQYISLSSEASLLQGFTTITHCHPQGEFQVVPQSINLANYRFCESP